MSNIATYILASLSENKLQKMAFEINDELHQVVNAVNMYREITNHDMQYVWFGEFCRVLDAQTKENFYCNVLGGSRNLVENPLGYDLTSHSAFFIGTMHYNFPIDEVESYRSEEHTSELQSHHKLVCRLLLEKKKKKQKKKERRKTNKKKEECKQSRRDL